VNSIRRELLVALLAAITLTLLFAAYAIYRSALAEVDDLFDYQLRQFALSLRDQALHNLFAPPPENDQEEFDFVLQVWNPEGVRLYYSHPHRTLPGLVEPGYATIDTPEGAWRVFSTRLYNQAIQVAQPLRVRNRMAWNTASHLLQPFLILLPVLSIIIWMLVTRGLRPLQRLARAVGERTPRALDPLPEEQAPQEVLPLVRSLNDLLGRLSEAIATQQAFIADAAHELRTPIAALQLQVQILERAGNEDERSAALADLRAGIGRAGHGVQQLLTLARQDPQPGARARETVDLTQLARQVITEQIPLARAKDVDLGLDSAQAAIVLGDPEALRVLLANLVDNAVRYTPGGGRVDLVTGSTEDGIFLEVSDSGPGIPEADHQRVFDRFYRGAPNQTPGTGLGLAIVKTIADRHAARITLGVASLGGLWIRVEF
jgi:two-component system OmpR family sensor kinase